MQLNPAEISDLIKAKIENLSLKLKLKICLEIQKYVPVVRLFL